MEGRHRRVNIIIGEDQYRALSEKNLNLSGLVRDLLGDYLSANTITIQVSEETRRLYDLLIANTGSSDEEIEIHLRTALAKVLEQKIAEMQTLHRQLSEEIEALRPPSDRGERDEDASEGP